MDQMVSTNLLMTERKKAREANKSNAKKRQCVYLKH